MAMRLECRGQLNNGRLVGGGGGPECGMARCDPGVTQRVMCVGSKNLTRPTHGVWGDMHAPCHPLNAQVTPLAEVLGVKLLRSEKGQKKGFKQKQWYKDHVKMVCEKKNCSE